ncbi:MULTISPECIES: hypothetical protein [unclassified Paenibacillus]|uniref:hypothetical protein n=1 Tax=unclassified Paenibacillus TaxID=185978 RepID=UPI00362E8AEE
MDLGYGEYLIISACLNSKYDYKKIEALILGLSKKGMECIDVCYLGVNPKTVTYEDIWNGVENHISNDFSVDDLVSGVLSFLECKFTNGLNCRINVSFLDELSYEVSLSFNYSDVTTSNNLSFIEHVGLISFEALKPAFGVIGIERSVCGVKALIEDVCELPTDRAFYSGYLYESAKNEFNRIFKQADFIKEIPNTGIYFRKNAVSEFSLRETTEEISSIAFLKHKL